MVAKGQDGGMGVECSYKCHNRRDSCGDRTVLYLNRIDVNILLMMLYHGFARYHYWGKWGESLHNFFTSAYETKTISKFNFKMIATL